MTDYRMGHSAPEDDGYSAQLPAVRDRFGPDILDQPDLYGTCDDETLRQMTVAVDDPDTMVRIYRAVPPEHLEINRGDWVTLSRAYAHDHGYVDDRVAWPVVFADVPARQVWTDGNDPSEYGYGGPDLTGLDGYAESDVMPPPPASGPARAPDEETIQFTPSQGAREERRVPPTSPAVTRAPDRSI
ncbi:hypothetical protein ATK17_3800 [Branchiibius hedensis]|uniref:Uncharacterized protein n=1 Tax=Branchiibius hedensis TaxID=672460 RepID=A0A2Y9C6X2_9MICO|nr:hypothetical protein [Branchiibius hedensis]PWJ23306.1 hypothetical protein ATK17_3800 [Branchiibius hedensis]SSA58995.1 hypothetical protein SAMN04489750_3800 [Branchiibius hedensis]